MQCRAVDNDSWGEFVATWDNQPRLGEILWEKSGGREGLVLWDVTGFEQGELSDGW